MTQHAELIRQQPRLALQEWFGSPAVLSTESVDRYHEIASQICRCQPPRDIIELILLKDLIDATWDVTRYTRHKTLSIDRRFRQRLQFQAARVKMLAERKAQQADKEQRAEEQRLIRDLPPDIQRLEATDMLADAAKRVDEILSQGAQEHDHAHALEVGIVYHEKLDGLLNKAIARRNNALDQLKQYRHGLGQVLRNTTDDVIDAEFETDHPTSANSGAPDAQGDEQQN